METRNDSRRSLDVTETVPVIVKKILGLSPIHITEKPVTPPVPLIHIAGMTFRATADGKNIHPSEINGLIGPKPKF